MAVAIPPRTQQSIRALIDSNRIVSHFQPIVSTRQRTIVGLEALARGAGQDGMQPSADWLFAGAARESLMRELEQLCCDTAIQRFARLPYRQTGLLLFLNTGGWLTSPHVDPVAHLRESTRRAGLPPSSVAVEILEARIDDLDRLTRLVSRLREAGFLLALDDVGSGHSNLDRISVIRPDILKVDRSLITRIESDFYKQETLKSLVGLSRKIGSLVVAEGVETEDEAIVALELGADLMQGYFVSRPSEHGSIAPGHSVSACGDALGQRFKRYMIDKIHRRKTQHRGLSLILTDVLARLAGSGVSGFDGILRETLRDHPSVECLYVLDHTGIQVTDTICNPGAPRQARGIIFHPASKGTDHSLKEYFYILLDVELQKFTTDPYVSFASGNICRTTSTYFRTLQDDGLYVLCIDVATAGSAGVGTGAG